MKPNKKIRKPKPPEKSDPYMTQAAITPDERDPRAGTPLADIQNVAQARRWDEENEK